MTNTPETDKAYNSGDADGPDRIDRLLACSARFESENASLRDALNQIAEDSTCEWSSKVAKDALSS